MTIRTRDELAQDFTTMEDPSASFYDTLRASGRIRLHLVAIPEALAKPLTAEEVPQCFCFHSAECDVGPDGTMCPGVDSVMRFVLPVLLKRIGAE